MTQRENTDSDRSSLNWLLWCLCGFLLWEVVKLEDRVAALEAGHTVAADTTP